MIEITFELAKRLTQGGFFERRRAMQELRELVALNDFEDCVSEPEPFQPSRHWSQVARDDNKGVSHCYPPETDDLIRVGPCEHLSGGGSKFPEILRFPRLQALPCRSDQSGISLPPGEYTIDNQGAKHSFTVPQHAKPPADAVPCGTHPDNDGLDEFRGKP